MDLHVWLGFVAASAAMGLIPGPGVLSIIGYALGSGRRTALSSVAGMAVGNVIAMTLSLAGVGALLAASALAFSILKWAGAIFLIGLGIKTLIDAQAARSRDPGASVPIAPRLAFMSNVAVGTFHPKTIVFFVAFVPQFISAQADYLTQSLILIATFGLVVAATDTAYALLASRASEHLRKPEIAIWTKRASGGVLIAAGAATAASRG